MTTSIDYPEYDDYDPNDDEPEEYDPMDDCALDDDGYCGHAGSEHCDFECPMRDSSLFRGSDALFRKHKLK